MKSLEYNNNAKDLFKSFTDISFRIDSEYDLGIMKRNSMLGILKINMLNNILRSSINEYKVYVHLHPNDRYLDNLYKILHHKYKIGLKKREKGFVKIIYNYFICMYYIYSFYIRRKNVLSNKKKFVEIFNTDYKKSNIYQYKIDQINSEERILLYKEINGIFGAFNNDVDMDYRKITDTLFDIFKVKYFDICNTIDYYSILNHEYKEILFNKIIKIYGKDL